jgi:histidine kinase
MPVLGFWRQLKWRIIAANMLVVLVGVAAVLLMAYLATRFIVPNAIVEGLSELADSSSGEVTGEEISAVEITLLNIFRQSIGTSVFFAAASAIIAGLIASLLLVREILRPLRQIAASSRRIAGGHYNERIAVPVSDELAQVAANFNDMAEALARMEETRVALIGDVSHELRTPLTSLAGYLEGMIDGLFPINEETVALMYHEVRRMRRLVDDLQMLSRVEAGQFTLKLTNIDIRGLVEQVVAKLQPQWQAQSIEMNIILPTTAIVVHVDEDRLAQILLNIVGNAITHTPNGGKISLTVDKRDRLVFVSVEDTGIGFTDDEKQYLFERFYQADRSSSNSGGGSGIGLTISRHLAWAMGGELTASSEGKGKGSTFTLSLPLTFSSP